MPPPHNFIYFGTPAVAADTLAALIAAGFAPRAVVTSPDAPRGRGLTLTPCETKAVAERHGIRVFTPEKLDEEAMAAVRALQADYAVVVAYGKIFPEAFIASFPKGVVNVHYSLLPKYRGATPLETALLHGETETGVTIQQMAYELDAGDLLAQETTPIGAAETARELRPRLIEMGARLLIATLPAFERGEIRAVPQDASQATRAKKIQKTDGELDLAADARENWNKYRAYADSVGTYFFKDGTRYKVTSAAFAGGAFRVLRVIPEGKKETDWRG